MLYVGDNYEREITTSGKNLNIFKALDSGKDIWKELISLGLLPQTQAREELRGFSPKELNMHFACLSLC